MRIFRTIPMPFLAFTGAVVCSSKKIGEPYFCYYRLLPQVARTYLCTRNLSDSPFLEKGGHDHTSHVHAVALDYPNNTKSWNRKEHDHTSSVHAVAPSRWKPKIDGSPIPPRRTWRFLFKIGEPFFQPLSGISLRPPQTCFRTCGYLFRALQ